MRRRIAQWENQDPQLLRDYRAVCSSLGQEVRLETPSGDVTGHVDEIYSQTHKKNYVFIHIGIGVERTPG